MGRFFFVIALRNVIFLMKLDFAMLVSVKRLPPVVQEQTTYRWKNVQTEFLDRSILRDFFLLLPPATPTIIWCSQTWSADADTINSQPKLTTWHTHTQKLWHKFNYVFHFRSLPFTLPIFARVFLSQYFQRRIIITAPHDVSFQAHACMLCWMCCCGGNYMWLSILSSSATICTHHQSVGATHRIV